MLVPLTASLYVPGKLDDAEKVLVDVGTGYFIEVSFSYLLTIQINTRSYFFFILKVESSECVLSPSLYFEVTFAQQNVLPFGTCFVF